MTGKCGDIQKKTQKFQDFSDFFGLKFLVSGSKKNYNDLCEGDCTGCIKNVNLPEFNLQFITVEQVQGIINNGSISQSEKRGRYICRRHIHMTSLEKMYTKNYRSISRQ